MLVQWCPTLMQCGRDRKARGRVSERPQCGGCGAGSMVGQRAGSEGLRGAGVHSADINPESVLYARVKLRHSNDPRWVQGHRGR